MVHLQSSADRNVDSQGVSYVRLRSLCTRQAVLSLVCVKDGVWFLEVFNVIVYDEGNFVKKYGYRVKLNETPWL
jgi:hypothetical protein